VRSEEWKKEEGRRIRRTHPKRRKKPTNKNK